MSSGFKVDCAFVLILLTCIHVAHSSSTKKTCTYTSAYDDASCRQRGFHNVPKDLNVTVKSLNLDGNLITQLHSKAFLRYPFIGHLYVTSNNLSILQPQVFFNLTKLASLDLAKNSLSVLNDGVFTSDIKILTWLALNKNKLTKLSQHTFDNLTALTHLDVSENSISSIHPHSFNKLRNLNILMLTGNKLTTPSSGWFSPLLSFSNLHKVDLKDNPWTCDCNMEIFHEWVLQQTRYKALFAITCAAPPQHAKKALSALNKEDFTCDAAVTSTKASSSNPSSSAAAAVISILVIAVAAVVIGVWWFKKKRNSYEGLLSNPATFEPTLDDVMQSPGDNYNTPSTEAYL